MGVTTISSITNESQIPIFVMNVEHPSDTPNGGDAGPRIDPYDTLPFSMWIPWAAWNQDFPEHHIAVYDQTGAKTYGAIWQANRNGDDAVRFSPDGLWHDPGQHVGRMYQVDGNRDVTIMASPGSQFFSVIMQPQPNPKISDGVYLPLQANAEGWSGVVQTQIPWHHHGRRVSDSTSRCILQRSQDLSARRASASPHISCTPAVPVIPSSGEPVGNRWPGICGTKSGRDLDGHQVTGAHSGWLGHRGPVLQILRILSRTRLSSRHRCAKGIEAAP